MEELLNELSLQINEVDLSDQDRQNLFHIIEKLSKEHRIQDFKNRRFAKDKSIVVNLLNASLKDMEKKNQLIEETNKELVQHRKLIEHKNSVLEMQKKHIQEQGKHLAENFAKLSASYSELEQFTYIASHDLKSPLRTISNFGQLLNKRIGSTLDEESKEFLDFMIKGARQMNTVICDLLEFAHINNKNQVESWFDLNKVLEIVQFNLAQPIKENEVTIIYQPLPKIWGFRSGLIQLFQNLIGNAIKFRKDDIAPLIRIRCEDRTSDFYFEVSDNGVGIEGGYEHKAFLPFQRINNLDRPGSGMGLAICKKVVNQHGGEITYFSELGKGTTFCFNLNKPTPENATAENILDIADSTV